MRRQWLDKTTPCKIGTIPMLVNVHHKDKEKMAVGNYVRVKYAEGGRWETVKLTRVDESGYFMADR